MPDTPVAPVAPSPKTRLPLYLVCLAVLGTSAVLYSYVTKYKETRTVLDQKTASLVVAQYDLKSVKTEYANYKKLTESKSSYVKRPSYYNGKVVLDGHGNPVYTITYIKDTHSDASGGSAVTTTTSQSVTVTQAVTVTVHQDTTIKSGVKINGAAFVSVLSTAFAGKVSRIGVGVVHNFWLGTVVGLGVGTSDVKNVFSNAYLDINLGYGIP